MFLCQGCKKTLFSPQALCNTCVCSLEIGCSLCPTCYKPLPHECTFAGSKPLDSLFCFYHLTDHTYSVLKQWKIKRGLLFDQQILHMSAIHLEDLKQKLAQALIPIPQYFFRSFFLHGSPAKRICQYLAQNIHLPVYEGFEPIFTYRHQASKSKLERHHDAAPFIVDLKIFKKIHTIFLVDDFLTTGSTLQHAALKLKNIGISKIHGICLGAKIH